MYWLIRCRPYSPSLLSAWSDGITPVISCMMIEALMYGFIARPTIDIARQAAAGEQVDDPERGVVLEELRERGAVDARQGDLGEHAVDDQDPEDEEDPAPDVRRAEGVEQ